MIDNAALAAPSAAGHASLNVLRQVGFGDRALDWPSSLSGGQRQRVALARALASDPHILLLDEPLGALDALTRLDMQRLVESIWSELRFTAVLVTHDVVEAVTLSDRVVVLREGDHRAGCHHRSATAAAARRSGTGGAGGGNSWPPPGRQRLRGPEMPDDIAAHGRAESGEALADVLWFIPTHGDGRYLGKPIGAGPVTLDYISQIARAADSLGYFGVLLPTGASCEDYLGSWPRRWRPRRGSSVIWSRCGQVCSSLPKPPAWRRRSTGFRRGACSSTS